MTFETIEINKILFLTVSSMAFLLLATLCGIYIGLGLIDKMSDKKYQQFYLTFKTFLLSLVGIAVFMSLFYWVGDIGEDTNRSNTKALVSNIEQKYDVDEVQLKAFDTVTRPHQTSSQKVNVKVDGTTYMFYLTQDRNTWEPTLADPPVPGGSNTKPSITANELLKK